MVFVKKCRKSRINVFKRKITIDFKDCSNVVKNGAFYSNFFAIEFFSMFVPPINS
jgi:hypothetical protein